MAVEAPVRLEPTFSIGAVVLQELLVTNEGLQTLNVAIEQMSFADGMVNVPTIRAVWTRDKGLVFSGDMNLRIFERIIHGEAEIGLDTDGSFDHGKLMVKALGDFTIIPNALTLTTPGFYGDIEKDGEIGIGIFSDVHSRFGMFGLDATRAHVDYKKGEGSELRGGVDRLVLTIGDHVTLTVREAELRRGRLTAKEASLLYDHDPANRNRDDEALDTIAFPKSFLGFTGLKSLRIGGRVRDLEISSGRVQAAATEPHPPSAPRQHTAQDPSGRQASVLVPERPDVAHHEIVDSPTDDLAEVMEHAWEGSVHHGIIRGPKGTGGAPVAGGDRAPSGTSAARETAPDSEQPRQLGDIGHLTGRDTSPESSHGPRNATHLPASMLPRVKAGSIEPVLAGVGMTMLGVTATLDMESRRGSLQGKVGVSPPVPSLDIEFPIVPQIGLMGHVSLEVDARLGADIGGSLAILEGEPMPFALAGNAGIDGSVSVVAKAGAHFGSYLIAALGASLFAEARADVSAGAGLSGTIYFDKAKRTFRQGVSDTDRVKATYKLGADLKASAGVVVEARALYVFKGQLFKYTFKEWDLGTYLLEGELRSTKDGGAEAVHYKGAFDTATGHPNPPVVECEEPADARAILLEKGTFIAGCTARQSIIRELIQSNHDAQESMHQKLAAAVAEYEHLHHRLTRHWYKYIGKARAFDATLKAEWEAELEEVKSALDRLDECYCGEDLECQAWNAALEQDDELEAGTFDIASFDKRVREYIEQSEHERSLNRLMQRLDSIGRHLSSD